MLLACLFTSAPINEVKIPIFDLLSKDRNLCKRTKLTVQDIMLCLKLCFNFTVFSFKNTLYRQVFEAPMGSCISPVVANIFMAYVEKTALNTFHTPLTIWIRFVDDLFCTIKRSCVREFHDHQMAYLPSSSSLMNLKWTVDCHFWMFSSLVNTMALSPLQFITSPHTEIATTFHTTLDITNALLLAACTVDKHHTDYCMQSLHVKQTLALNGYPRKYFCCQRKATDKVPSYSFL